MMFYTSRRYLFKNNLINILYKRKKSYCIIDSNSKINMSRISDKDS